MVARILSELAAMGLTFQPEGNRLAHRLKPVRPVDNSRMGDLLYSLKPHHQQAIEYLRENGPKARVIPFRKRGTP